MRSSDSFGLILRFGAKASIPPALSKVTEKRFCYRLFRLPARRAVNGGRCWLRLRNRLLSRSRWLGCRWDESNPFICAIRLICCGYNHTVSCLLSVMVSILLGDL